jgi:hypothetical protein
MPPAPSLPQPGSASTSTASYYATSHAHAMFPNHPDPNNPNNQFLADVLRRLHASGKNMNATIREMCLFLAVCVCASSCSREGGVMPIYAGTPTANPSLSSAQAHWAPSLSFQQPQQQPYPANTPMAATREAAPVQVFPVRLPQSLRNLRACHAMPSCQNCLALREADAQLNVQAAEAPYRATLQLQP